MAAGIADHQWTLEEIIGLLDNKIFSNSNQTTTSSHRAATLRVNQV